MGLFVVVVGGVLVALVLGPAAGTVRGARVRGAGPWLAALSGIGFPLTWAVWYVVDTAAPARPAERRTGRRAGRWARSRAR